MGKKNVVVNNYLADKERFADLFNVVIFEGKQVYWCWDWNRKMKFIMHYP